MALLVSLLVVLSTLAFGSVYAWGYLPLFISAACIGLGAIVHAGGIPRELRSVSAGLALVALAIAFQLVPFDAGVLGALSPKTPDMLSRYVVGFGTSSRHALSVDTTATARGLGAVLALSVYAVGMSTLLSRRRIRFLAESLLVFGVLLALVGMYFREHNNGLVYGFWRARQTAAADSFGPFVNRNHFAGWMLMAVSLAIGRVGGRIEYAAKRIQPSFQRRLDWLSSADAALIAAAVIAVIVMATSLVWSMSRSGILSLSVGMACFAWLVIRRRVGSGRQRAAGVAVLAVVLFAGLSWRGFDRLIRWFGDTRDVVSRFGAWSDGWQVIKDFPLTGTGINTYGIDMLYYQQHNVELWMSHAHNDYLQLAAEGGVLVMAPLALAAVLFVVSVRQRVNQVRASSEGYWLRAGACIGMLAIAAQEAVEFSLHIPANMFLFATLAAIALSPIQTPPDARTT